MKGRRVDEEIERQAIEIYRRLLSEYKVAEELKIDRGTVRRILVRNNEPRRSVGSPEMYPKTDFSRDPKEQARILGFVEDCWAGYNGNQIRVHTTTTHPAQIELFNDIFGAYGHVSKYPTFNRRYSHYQWHPYVYLNGSFEFVLEYKRNPLELLRTHICENGTVYIYVGSLTDAEGSVFIDTNKGHPRPGLCISNTNPKLLEFAQKTIGGYISRYGGVYQLQLFRKQAVEALQQLPIAHAEKAAFKQVVLRHYNNGGIGLDALKEHQELRRRIDEKVQLRTMQARLEWIRRHGRPHRFDPDQTIPPI